MKATQEANKLLQEAAMLDNMDCKALAAIYYKEATKIDAGLAYVRPSDSHQEISCPEVEPVPRGFQEV